LRELLGDRAPAGAELALAEVAAQRLVDRLPVEAAVLVEAGVLGRDDGEAEVGRDALERPPGPAQAEGAAGPLGLAPAQLDEGGRLRRRRPQRGDVRQGEDEAARGGGGDDERGGEQRRPASASSSPRAPGGHGGDGIGPERRARGRTTVALP